MMIPPGVPGRLLSGAYLMTGPSLALLSVSTSLGMAAPVWVTCVIPAVLPISALAYYRSLGPMEDDEIEATGEIEQVEDENWATEISVQPNDAVLSVA